MSKSFYRKMPASSVLFRKDPRLEDLTQAFKNLFSFMLWGSRSLLKCCTPKVTSSALKHAVNTAYLQTSAWQQYQPFYLIALACFAPLLSAEPLSVLRWSMTVARREALLHRPPFQLQEKARSDVTTSLPFSHTLLSRPTHIFPTPVLHTSCHLES